MISRRRTLNEMSEKYNIEELLIKKLEGLEIEPSGNAWMKTSRALRRKEFMRFQLRKMNVFYVAGLVVVGVGLATLLISDRTGEDVERRTSNVERGAENKIIEENDTPQIISDNKTTTVKTQEQADEKVKRVLKRKKIKEKYDLEKNESSEAIVLSDKATSNQQPATRNPQPATDVKTLITYFTASVTEGCAPLEVEFTNHSENAASYSWSFGENKANQVYTFNHAGEHTVVLTAINQEGIQQSYSEVITVYPRPVADFEIEKGHIYNYSTDAIEYDWFFKDVDSKLSLLSNDFQPELVSSIQRSTFDVRLLLTAKNSQGCIDTISAVITGPKAPSLTFPSAFSPNPSGPSSGFYNPNEPGNKIFHPRFTEEPIEYNLKIYNRTGELIFQTIDIHIGWDGYYRDLPVLRGVYIWKCTGKWKNGQLINQQGDITALWNF